MPLEAINAASAREKSIRHGHPSTLHLWWARRPLAAARAVIWSSLVDDHTFGRMESIWKPVAANEGFEVVRRRLFLDCKNPEGRELVCNRFSQMYVENSNDFPPEAREVEYRERMVSCYPIHPEIFDRLYEDWGTLDKFQRTRGVLRLMAAVIHELWMGNDASAMIMPGSIALDVPNVREELTRYLEQEGWNAIVDREVDGKKSIPYQKDQTVPRYGQKLAARRVARTIMLGSAPTDRAQSVRGIEASRIRLGVVQPGESIADFNDALNTLQTSLAYLYSNLSGNRFWYDTRPTLRKTVEDRATQIPDIEVEYEIEKRLQKLRRENYYPFAGLHVCPASSLDVTDEKAVRLVILKPGFIYKATRTQNEALIEVQNILNNHGMTPRVYRNMLAFVAPDQDQLVPLKEEIRRYLAWSSIKEDKEVLNLDVSQNKETDNNLHRSDETVRLRIDETYCWLLVPYIDRNVDIKEVIWDRIRINGGSDRIVERAARKMLQNEALITKWAPALLLVELDGVLWKESDHISVKKLWEYLCTYCYLPRLANYNVLEEAIKTGLHSTEYFALAAGISNDKYLDLKYNQYVNFIDQSAYLVKLVAALKQMAEMSAGQTDNTVKGTGYNIPENDDNKFVHEDQAEYSGENGTSEPTGKPTNTAPNQPAHTHFFMSALLDNTRINRDVQRLVEEVISHLTNVDGVKVEVSLEVTAESLNGLSQTTVRTISENCQTLKVKDFGFDK